MHRSSVIPQRGVYGNRRVRVGAEATPDQGRVVPYMIVGGTILLLAAVVRDELRAARPQRARRRA